MTETTGEEGNGVAGGDVASQCRLLSLPEDRDVLTPVNCLVRCQIEVFVTTPFDLSGGMPRGGVRDGGVDVGRVGIRCVHCKGGKWKQPLAAGQTTRGAVSYPRKIALCYQSVRNWQRFHLMTCPSMPDAVKERYLFLKEKGEASKRRGGNKSSSYWEESLKKMGLVDSDRGIRLNKSGFTDDGVTGNEVISFHVDESNAGAIGDEIGINNTPSASSVPCSPVLESSNDANRGNAPPIGGTAAATKGKTSTKLQSVDTETPVLASPNFLPEITHDCSIGKKSLPSSLVSPHERKVCIPEHRSSMSLATKDVRVSAELPHSNQMLLLQKLQTAENIIRAMMQMRQFAPGDAACNQTTDEMHTSSTLHRHDHGEEMRQLGTELYELFSGQRFHTVSTDAESEESTSSDIAREESRGQMRRKREKRPETQTYAFLIDCGLPPALCSIVTSLLEHGEGCCGDYESMEAVEYDFSLMVSEPEKYLFRIADDGILHIDNTALFGRDEETFKLLKAFERVTMQSTGLSSNEMVLVSGPSGAGKSVLVRGISGRLVQEGACFVSGKFDSMKQLQPLSALVTALDDYCKILSQHADRIEVVRKDVSLLLGKEGGAVLSNLIPSLNKIVTTEEDQPSQPVVGGEALQRLMFLFRVLLRATCSHTHPIVLFLDDLQWADDVSFKLMQALILDDEIKGLLLIGCYRQNEVGTDHSLISALGNIQHMGRVRITSINVGNLNLSSVNAMLSNVLHLVPGTTRSLAKAVMGKTGGNALFVVQFLSSLHDEGLLRFSLLSRRWEWDIDKIIGRKIADNVVGLMTDQMLKLAPEVLEALQVAAAFGDKCKEEIFEIIDRAPGSVASTVSSLDVAVAEGLMIKTESVYRFAHDQIQHSAYLLIPETDREAFHLGIGRLLWKVCTNEEMETHLFLVVDQLHRGSKLITDCNERADLAHKSLIAGEMASSMSAFLPASAYLKAGINLLSDNDWSCNRDLCFDLFNAYAETQFILGHFDDVEAHLELTLSRAETLKEKLRAYFTLVQSIGAQGNASDALDTALKVLGHIGEPIASTASQATVKQELVSTQGLLQSKTTDDILHLRNMEDDKKKEAMRFLDSVMIYALGERRQLIPVLVSRMVRLSLLYGVCKESAHGFACYGWILCGLMNNYELGYRFGKIALSLLERFQCTEHLAKVACPVYAFIAPWVEPLQSSLPPLKRAMDVAMATGDTHYAMAAAQCYLGNALCSGQKLGPLLDEAELYSKQMMECKQRYVFAQFSRPLQQAIMILHDGPMDANVMAGDFDSSKLIAIVEEIGADDCDLSAGSATTNQFIRGFYQTWLYYLFGKYDLAWHVAEKNHHEMKQASGRFLLNCGHVFYAGLTALTLARSEGRSDYIGTIEETVAQMKIWATSTPWNCGHKLALMNAEYAYLNGDTEGAANAYKVAINLAAEHSFFHEQALALERAAVFHLECGAYDAASSLFKKAFDCYIQWGAHRKAMQIQEYYL